MTFSIESGNSAGVFAIDAASGQITGAKAVLDYETAAMARFELDVKATDRAGLSGTGRVVVTVEDVNEPPVFQTTSIQVDENTDKTPLTDGSAIGDRLSVTDPDAGHTAGLTFGITAGDGNGYFAIESSGARAGQLKVSSAGAKALAYETTTKFTVTVMASDPGSPSKSTTQSIDINVQNVNERPVVDAVVKKTVDEAVAAGTSTQKPVRTRQPPCAAAARPAGAGSAGRR